MTRRAWLFIALLTMGNWFETSNKTENCVQNTQRNTRNLKSCRREWKLRKRVSTQILWRVLITNTNPLFPQIPRRLGQEIRQWQLEEIQQDRIYVACYDCFMQTPPTRSELRGNDCYLWLYKHKLRHKFEQKRKKLRQRLKTAHLPHSSLDLPSRAKCYPTFFVAISWTTSPAKFIFLAALPRQKTSESLKLFAARSRQTWHWKHALDTKRS